MSVRSAMVDKARTVSRTSAGTRVDGETPMTDAQSEWFKCRLSPPTTQEIRQDSFYNRSRDFTLIVYPKDLSGQPVHIEPNMRLEIDSVVYGSDIYEIGGEVVPIRSKRKLVMFQLAISKHTED